MWRCISVRLSSVRKEVYVACIVGYLITSNRVICSCSFSEVENLCFSEERWWWVALWPWTSRECPKCVLIERRYVRTLSIAAVWFVFRRVLRIANMRLLASSYLSVRPHGTTLLPLDGFWWNLISEYFPKFCWENSSFIKIWPE